MSAPTRQVGGGGGGGGADFTIPAGVHCALLAEVFFRGWLLYDNFSKKYVQADASEKKANPAAYAFFLFPGFTYPEGEFDRAGQPMVARLEIPNLGFNNKARAQYKAGDQSKKQWVPKFDRYLEAWQGGRPVPPERQAGFVFGRELGTGTDENGHERWNPDLTGDALREQAKRLPGVAIGRPASVHIIHSPRLDDAGNHKEDDDGNKLYWGNIAPVDPPDAPAGGSQTPEFKEWLRLVENWVPGLSPASAECKALKWADYADKYTPWEVIQANKDGGGQQQQPQPQGAPPQQGVDLDAEPDDDIPF